MIPHIDLLFLGFAWAAPPPEGPYTFRRTYVHEFDKVVVDGGHEEKEKVETTNKEPDAAGKSLLLSSSILFSPCT